MFISCNNAQEDDFGNCGYAIQKPFKVIELVSELNEISGICYYQTNRLICNHDENANLYIIDFQNGTLAEKVENIVIGDFEDLEYIENRIYMLKNNGTIFEFDIKNIQNKQNVEFTTPLTKGNDTEGLCYDKKTNSLLIACKNKPGLKGAKNEILNSRFIYQFDLQTKKLIESPFLKIDLGKLTKYGINNFMPSGIAVHPITGNFYILSANRKALIVLDRENKLLSATKLKSKQFSQPEGICFDPEGNFLFISNEGKQSKPNILIFNKL
jgi:uncharacterized protein YjiK